MTVLLLAAQTSTVLQNLTDHKLANTTVKLPEAACTL